MNTLRVLTYHRVASVDASPSLHPGLINATPSVFARQMDFLARHYRVVSMEAVLEAVQSGRRLPQKAVLITFDDAYQDFKDFAWPILQSKCLPATVFVPTAFAAQRNSSFWWDRLYRAFRFSSQNELRIVPLGLLQFSTSEELLSNLKRFQDYLKTLPYNEAMQMAEETCLRLNAVEDGQRSTMNWKELRQLMKEGVTLGSHTCTHRILTNLSLTQVREEITGSFEDLKRETGTSLPIFSYPNGNTNNQIVEILRQEGVILAFGGKDGHNNLRTADHLCLCRTGITRKTTPFIFRLRLLRPFTYIDRWRHRWVNSRRLKFSESGPIRCNMQGS